MITQIFTIYDSKAKAYLKPFFSVNSDTAKRELSVLVNEPKHNFHDNASDYVLYCNGIFQESNAHFDIFKEPENICNLDQLKKEVN